MAQPIKCAKCSRPYNSSFPACPFCKNPTVPVGSPTAGMKTDYVARAECFAADKIYLDVDFSLATVTTLDVFINDTWGTAGESPGSEEWQASQGKTAVIMNVGCYFGEVLRRHWGGQWIEDPAQGGNPLWTVVKLPMDIAVYPIAKVFKRFKNGKEDSLEPLLLSLLPRLPVKPQQPESWLRQIAFFEKIKRFDLALIFYERLLRLPIPSSQKQQYEARMNHARTQSQPKAMEAVTQPSQPASVDFVKGREEIIPVLELAGVKPDFTPASLAGIDTWLQYYWGPEPKEKTEIEGYDRDEWRLGCYLGEVFLRMGGAWKTEASYPATSHIVWPSGFMTCPFAYFSKRLERGGEYPVYAQFEFCRKILVERKDIPPVNDESDQWLDQAEFQADAFTGRRDIALQMALKALEINPDSLRGRMLACQWSFDTIKNPSQALEHLKKAADLGAPKPEIQRWLLRFSERRGNHEAQIEAARKLRELAPGDTESRIMEALGLCALKRYKEAMPILKEVLDPNAETVDHRAWLRLGDCQYHAGLVDEAIASWQKARNWEPVGMEATWKLAQILEKQQRWTECLAACRRMLEYKNSSASLREKAEARAAAIENHPAYLEEEADRLAAAGKFQEAVDAYGRLTAIQPGNAKAWREQGVGLSLLNRMDEALAAFDRAMAADPKDPQALDHKAVALGRSGRFADGLALLEQGVKALPDAAILWTRRSFFLGKADRWETALASAEKAIAIDPSAHQAYLFKAEAERRLGRIDAAIVSLKQFLKIAPPEKQQAIQSVHQMLWDLEHPGRVRDPRKAAMLQDTANATMQAGRREEGLDLFRQASEEEPTSFEIWNNFGSALMSVGRVEEALACFDRAIALYPTLEMFHYNRALTLEKLGRMDETLAVYDQLLVRYVNHPETLKKRTRFLRRTERFAEAVESAERWIQAEPRSVEPLRTRAEALVKLKRHEEGLADYDRAIAMAPHDRNIWLEKAVALAEAGKKDESSNLIEKAFEDKAFADAYHNRGMDLFNRMFGSA